MFGHGDTRFVSVTPLSPAGVKTEDTADFGNSWHVDLPHQAPCEPVEDNFSGPCKSESDMEVGHRQTVWSYLMKMLWLWACVNNLRWVSSRASRSVYGYGDEWSEKSRFFRRQGAADSAFAWPQDAVEKCSVLLFFPFLSCHENIDPNPFVASCVSDLCVWVTGFPASSAPYPHMPLNTIIEAVFPPPPEAGSSPGSLSIEGIIFIVEK